MMFSNVDDNILMTDWTGTSANPQLPLGEGPVVLIAHPSEGLLGQLEFSLKLVAPLG
jgi:hypothetical protein